MYDKNWLNDVRETKGNFPAARVAVGQILDIPTRNLLAAQLQLLEQEFEYRLQSGFSIYDTAQKVREILILADELVR